jgi:hypothetical protein
MISWDRQSARLTAVPAISQPFGDGSSAGAFLRRAGGIDLDAYPRSLYRFREQDRQELAPADIMHRFGHHAAGQSFGVQVFDGDQAVAVDQHARDLVMKIPALVLDMRMYPLQGLDRLAVAMTPTLPASDLPLGTSELGLCRLEVARILDPRPVGECGERLQPNIEAHRFRALRQGNRVRLSAEADIPTPGFPLQGHGLDRALQGATPLDFQFSDALTIELAIIPELTAIPVSGEGVTVESIAAFEPGIARRITGLDAAEEGIEGLLDTPQDVLTGREVGQAQGAIGANRFELVGLVVIVQRGVQLPVGIAALLERGVIQDSRFVKLRLQGLGLFPRGIEATSVGFAHLLDSTLGVDIRTDGALAHMPDRSRIIRPTPQRGQPRPQGREFFSKDARRGAFQAVNDLCNAPTRVELNKEVHVVWHDLQGVHCHFQFGSLLAQKRFEPLRNRAREYRTPVFRTPNQVHFQGEDRSSIFSISSCHIVKYTTARYLVNKKGGSEPSSAA